LSTEHKVLRPCRAQARGKQSATMRRQWWGMRRLTRRVAMHENTFDGENDSRSIALGHYHDPRRPLDAPAGVMLGDERVQKGVLLLLMEIH